MANPDRSEEIEHILRVALILGLWDYSLYSFFLEASRDYSIGNRGGGPE